VNREIVADQGNWDAVLIKLPAAVCGGNGQHDLLSCVPSKYQREFEKQIDQWVQGGYLEKVFQRNMDVVIAREFMDSSSNYFREFFCQPWTIGKYELSCDGNRGSIQASFDESVQV